MQCLLLYSAYLFEGIVLCMGRGGGGEGGRASNYV
jgi:hypothetical protein